MSLQSAIDSVAAEGWRIVSLYLDEVHNRWTCAAIPDLGEPYYRGQPTGRGTFTGAQAQVTGHLAPTATEAVEKCLEGIRAHPHHVTYREFYRALAAWLKAIES